MKNVGILQNALTQSVETFDTAKLRLSGFLAMSHLEHGCRNKCGHRDKSCGIYPICRHELRGGINERGISYAHDPQIALYSSPLAVYETFPYALLFDRSATDVSAEVAFQYP